MLLASVKFSSSQMMRKTSAKTANTKSLTKLEKVSLLPRTSNMPLQLPHSNWVGESHMTISHLVTIALVSAAGLSQTRVICEVNNTYLKS